MRTTLDLDEGVLAAARALASDRKISLGAAVSELAKRGLRPEPAPTHALFPVFEVDPADPPITLEVVNAHRDDD